LLHKELSNPAVAASQSMHLATAMQQISSEVRRSWKQNNSDNEQHFQSRCCPRTNPFWVSESDRI